MTETELEYQFCFNCDDRKQCYTKPKDCTRIQEEIGLQEMTNEEWIKSLDTEQLAEWIASVVKKAISIKENNDIVMLESAVWWDEWLKQPHREENEK